MAYEIQNGEFFGMEVGERRGKRSPYPLRQMVAGQWIRVPYSDEFKLWRAVRNARHQKRIKFRVYLEDGGKYWIVLCEGKADMAPR
jgi:hypothetical protein